MVASEPEASAATHEILRTHHDGGLSRADVEGAWTRLCDRVWSHRGVSLLSTPDLGAADKDQVKLALDPLIGVEVHLVLTLDSLSQQLYGAWLAELRAGRTTGWNTYVDRVLTHGTHDTKEHRQAEDFWAGHEPAALLARWGWTFHADRLHVLADPDLTSQWTHLLDLARLGADTVASMPAVVPPYADPAGVAVLRKVNRQLEEPLRHGSADLLTTTDRERAAMPAAPTDVLEPLVERWAAAFAAAGHDVRGDLDGLLDHVDAGEGEGQRALPGARDQLGVAVDALADALTENSRLRRQVATVEADRERLDHPGADPLHEWAQRTPVRTHPVDQLVGVDDLVEAVAAAHRHRLVAQQLDARVVCGVPAR